MKNRSRYLLTFLICISCIQAKDHSYTSRLWRLFSGIAASYYAGSGLYSLTDGDLYGSLPGFLAAGIIPYVADLELNGAIIGISMLGVGAAHHQTSVTKKDSDMPYELALIGPGLYYLWQATTAYDKKEEIEERPDQKEIDE